MLFCDLVDSTRLSRQLDPEDYRTVIRAYRRRQLPRYSPSMATWRNISGTGCCSTCRPQATKTLPYGPCTPAWPFSTRWDR